MSVIIYLAVVVLMFASMWVIFEKAGLAGWKAIIPIYNTYCLCKITWGNGWIFLAFIVPLFTKSTVYVTLSPGIDKLTFIPVIEAALVSSIFAVPVVVALPIFVGLDRFSNLIPHFAASRYAVPFMFSVVDRAANATVKPAITINNTTTTSAFVLLSFSIISTPCYYLTF